MMSAPSKKTLSLRPRAMFVALALLGVFQARLAGQPAPGSYSESEREQLFEQTLAFFSPTRIPARYRDVSAASVSETKCPTMHFAWVRRNLDVFTPEQRSVLVELLSRPTGLELSYPSDSLWFLVHYTTTGADAVSSADRNNNGVPDFVEGVAEAFDRSHTVQVAEMGYTSPPDDRQIDGPEYDVYIQELGRGVYGFTTPEEQIPETPQNDFTSFIEVDNNFNNGHFTTGLPGAQVTAAHELFHAIQFGYRDAIFENDYFYYELCSSWMEDVVYDDINDYYSTVPSYLRRTDESFNQYERFTLFNYGAAIWNHFLVKKYGNSQLIRRSWEHMRANDAVIEAIDKALLETGSDFATAFPEFAAWSYFTGERANPADFFEEGAAYPSVELAGDLLFGADATIIDSCQTLAFKYYRFAIAEGDTFLIVGHVADNADIQVVAIVEKTIGAAEILFVDLDSGLNLGLVPPGSEVVVVVINRQALDGSASAKFSTTHSKFQFRLSRMTASPAGDQGISAIYPSPFIIDLHDYMFIEFSQMATVDIEIRILDSGGRVVKLAPFDRDPNFLDIGRYRWDGTDNEGQKVPSGVYLVYLRQANFDQFKKFALIRE